MTNKLLQCTCCGGAIDRVSMTCKYCGIQYKLDEEMRPIRIMEYQQKCKTISSKVIIPSYIVHSMGENEAMEMTLHEMAMNMAEKIMPLIEFEHQFEPKTMEYVTYGRLRVADPHTSSYREVLR